MNKFVPSLIDDNNSGNVYQNSQPTGLFSSNLVGGRRISRRKISNIYKSYKKRRNHKHSKRSIKRSMKSMPGKFLTRMFSSMKSKKMRKSRRQRGGNTAIDRALAAPARVGELTSCVKA
jgi:hypothetical protein